MKSGPTPAGSLGCRCRRWAWSGDGRGENNIVLSKISTARPRIQFASGKAASRTVLFPLTLMCTLHSGRNLL
jgi:hypothetical protein